MRVHIMTEFLFETQTSPLINVDKKLKILSITSKSKFIITNNYILKFFFSKKWTHDPIGLSPPHLRFEEQN